MRDATPLNTRIAAAADRRRAYRYRVTASGGSLAAQCPPGSHVIDWRDLGAEYTWHVYRFRPSVSHTGFASGVFVDAGYVSSGVYAPDAASREAPATEAPS